MGTVNLKDWFDSTYGGGTGLGFWNREDYSTPNNVPAWDALSPDQKLEFLKTGGISSLGFQDKAPNWAGAFDNRTPEQVLASGSVNFADPQGNEGIGGMLKTLGVFGAAAGLGGLMGGGWGNLSGLADAQFGATPNSVSYSGSIPGGASNMQSLWQAAQPTATGGGMDLTGFLQSYDPSNPFGFTGSEGGLPITNVGTGIPELGGQSFLDASMPGGYLDQSTLPSWMQGPVSMTQASSLSNLATELAKKVGTSAAQSVVSKIINGTATADDYAGIIGKLGSSALTYLGNQNLSSSLERIAAQGRSDRAPFLEAAKGAMSDPNAWAQTGPAQTLFKQQWAQLSPIFGNPAGAPAAQGIAADAGMRGWQNYVTSMGNLGLGNQAQNQSLQAQAATAANDTSPFGVGLQAITAPQQNNSLADIAKLFNIKGFA